MIWRALGLSLRRRFLGRGKPKAAAAWDSQYRSGSWDRLAAPRELPRYAVIAALVARFAPPEARVLDIGCGLGILGEHLAALRRSRRYVGLDLSGEAIGRAEAERGQAGEFRVADAEQPCLDPSESFHVLVFNEVLNYFDDPAQVVQRWLSHLAPGGFIVVSLWNPVRHRAMDRRLRAVLRRTLTVTIGVDRGAAWRITVEVPVSRARERVQGYGAASR